MPHRPFNHHAPCRCGLSEVVEVNCGGFRGPRGVLVPGVVQRKWLKGGPKEGVVPIAMPQRARAVIDEPRLAPITSTKLVLVIVYPPCPLSHKGGIHPPVSNI